MADEELVEDIPAEAAEEAVAEAPVADEAAAAEEEQTEEEAPLTRGQRRAMRHRELVETNRRNEERLERALAALEERGRQSEQPDNSAPDRDQFDDYEEYLDARAEWRAVQAVEQRTQAQAQQAREQAAAQEAQQLESRWAESHDNAIEAHDDYEDIFDAVGTSIDAPHALAIKGADDPAEVVYHLGKNPKELSRFKQLSGAALLRAVGRIEERLNVQRKQRSNAPKPVTPIKGSQPSSNALTDDLPQDEWLRRRNKQLGRA